MKLRKLFAILMTLALCIGMLSGCGSAGSSASAQASASVETASAPEEVTEPTSVPAPEPEISSEEVSSVLPEELAPEEDDAVPGTAAIAALEAGEIDQSCTLPLTEEETTLSYWCSTNFGPNATISSWNEHLGLSYAQEQTGVKLEIHECNMTVEREQFSLMLASNDLCDILVGFETQYTAGADNAIEEDLVINLLDYMEYAPVYGQLLETDPAWRNELETEGGNIISFKTLYTNFSWIGQSIAIRGDWLRELDMEVPTTYDEYFDVLSAFKSNFDPTYTLNIGSALGNSWFEGGYGIAVSAAGSASTNDFYVENGTVYSGYTSDRFHDYLAMLHDWYEAGLISNDYVTIGNLEFFEADYASLIAAGEFGCVMGAGGLLGMYASFSNDEDFEFIPSYQPRLSQDSTLCYLTPATYTGSNFAPSIALQCENIELAMAFLDYFYTEEGVELANYGIEGESFDYDENGEPQLSELITDAGDVSAALTPYKVNISTISDPNAQTRAMMTESACEIMQFWTEDQTGLIEQGNNAYYPANVTLTAEELEDATTILTDIATYVSESVPKFIMGTMSLGEWDAYCQAINDMGMEDVVAIYQASYDRYMA